ncbi:MAG: four helix bundle protein [Muribaculaceae bacterium]|nr:four helix bundle protein [Muribaculaceae bacterium]
MRNYRNYDFWQDSISIAKDVYILLKEFPNEERFALCSQLRRAVVSIASNIAEGSGRETESDFAHFLDIALGSACEVETQIEIAYKMEYISIEQRDEIVDKLQSIERRITGFIKKIREAK